MTVAETVKDAVGLGPESEYEPNKWERKSSDEVRRGNERADVRRQTTTSIQRQLRTPSDTTEQVPAQRVVPTVEVSGKEGME